MDFFANRFFLTNKYSPYRKLDTPIKRYKDETMMVDLYRGFDKWLNIYGRQMIVKKLVKVFVFGGSNVDCKG